MSGKYKRLSDVRPDRTRVGHCWTVGSADLVEACPGAVTATCFWGTASGARGHAPSSGRICCRRVISLRAPALSVSKLDVSRILISFSTSVVGMTTYQVFI